MDEAALKLLIEPGEYHCAWKLLNRDGYLEEFPGDLILEPDKGPSGSVHGNLPTVRSEDDSNVTTFPQAVQYPVLRGHLRNGYDVLLFKATVDLWFPGRAILHAQAAVVGLNLPGEDQNADHFTGLTLQITGLDLLAGVAPLKSFRFPNNGIHLEGEWSVTGNPESSQEWFGDGVTLRLEYVGSARIGDPYSFGMAFSPVLVITSAQGQALSTWLSDWVEPLRRLVSLATGNREKLTSFSLMWSNRQPSGPPRHGQVFGAGLAQSPYTSRYQELIGAKPALRLKTDDVSLLELCLAWQQLAKQHHPLVETYGAFLGADHEHPRSRVLLLVQALEGLHGFETKQEYEVRKIRHAGQREAALAAALPHLNTEQKQFLNNHLSKSPSRGFGNVRPLFEGLPVNVLPELASKRLIVEMANDPRSPKGPLEALRLIRNDLAHGTQGFDARGLEEVALILERVTRAHMLRALGCPVAVQQTALSQS